MNYWIFFFICANFFSAMSSPSQVQALEHTLNQLTSLQAQFSHEDSAGKRYRGTLFLKRPWKMRMQYDEPSPFLIVSDGQSLIYEDHSTFEATYLPLESSPLSFLLSEKTRLTDVFEIDDIKEKEGKITLTCRDKKNYFFLTILFDQKGKSILGWVSKDAQGNEIKINLYNIQRNILLKETLFSFQQKPRWRVKPKEHISL